MSRWASFRVYRKLHLLFCFNLRICWPQSMEDLKQSYHNSKAGWIILILVRNLYELSHWIRLAEYFLILERLRWPLLFLSHQDCCPNRLFLLFWTFLQAYMTELHFLSQYLRRFMCDRVSIFTKTVWNLTNILHLLAAKSIHMGKWWLHRVRQRWLLSCDTLRWFSIYFAQWLT